MRNRDTQNASCISRLSSFAAPSFEDTTCWVASLCPRIASSAQVSTELGCKSVKCEHHLKSEPKVRRQTNLANVLQYNHSGTEVSNVENWQLKINKSKVTNTFGKVFPT
jgi:hypothetical protein